MYLHSFPSGAPHRRLCRTCRGFTLIELLTVIAIVGILVVITIPVIGSMRNKARSTECVSNVRQLVQSFLLYANDNEGKLPAWERAGKSDENQSFRVLYREGYAQSPELFVCPVTQAANRAALGPSIIGDRYPCYYSSNQTIAPQWGPMVGQRFPRPTNLADENASLLPVVFDQRANAAATSSVNQHRPSAAVPGGVFGYLDGSVSYITSPANIIRLP